MDFVKCAFVTSLLFTVAFQVCLQIGFPFAKSFIHSLLISFSTTAVLYNSTKKQEAEIWKRKLNLEKHPLGGFFKETYRSTEGAMCLPQRYGVDAERKFATQIAYLVTDFNFTQFHKLKSDEIWHFVDGDPMLIYVIDAETGDLQINSLGRKEGCEFTALIPAGCYHASCLSKPKLGSYALATAMVCPGFEPEDAEVPTRSELLEKFPQHKDSILKLTRICETKTEVSNKLD